MLPISRHRQAPAVRPGFRGSVEFNHRAHATRVFQIFEEHLLRRRITHVCHEPVMQGGKFFCFLPLAWRHRRFPIEIASLRHCKELEEIRGVALERDLDKIDRIFNPNEHGYYGTYFTLRALAQSLGDRQFLAGFALGAMISRLTNRLRDVHVEAERREVVDLHGVLRRWTRRQVRDQGLPPLYHRPRRKPI